MPRNTRANRVPSTPAVSPPRVQLFRNERAREAYEKLNSKRKIWAERYVILDEVDPAIRANLESRGWLSLLEIDHPPPTALIREFFSNFSCHIYDSNTVVQSWIRGEEFTITPRVVAEALGVPIVTDPIYPYNESPPNREFIKKIAKKFKKIKKIQLWLLFKRKLVGKRREREEIQIIVSFRSYPMCNRKFQTNSKKIQKIKIGRAHV